MKFKKGTGTMTAKVRGESIGAGFSSGVKGVGWGEGLWRMNKFLASG